VLRRGESGHQLILSAVEEEAVYGWSPHPSSEVLLVEEAAFGAREHPFVALECPEVPRQHLAQELGHLEGPSSGGALAVLDHGIVAMGGLPDC
jgi:hypothetical protein